MISSRCQFFIRIRRLTLTWSAGKNCKSEIWFSAQFKPWPSMKKITISALSSWRRSIGPSTTNLSIICGLPTLWKRHVLTSINLNFSMITWPTSSKTFANLVSYQLSWIRWWSQECPKITPKILMSHWTLSSWFAWKLEQSPIVSSLRHLIEF